MPSRLFCSCSRGVVERHRVVPLADELSPIPVTVIAGFLGSGKTTLLNRMLRANKPTERIAVIVNEFGSVGIDGALVEGGAQFVELDNGCLCCALNEDLSETLRALVARGDVDRILIETTGVADPLPVAWSATKPDVVGALRLDAIVVLLDAEHGAEVLQTYPAARLQLERADVVLISKVDLTSDRGLSAQAAARELQPHAPLLFAGGDEVPYEALFGVHRNGPLAAVPTPTTHSHAGHDIDCVTWQRPVADGVIDERRAEDFAYEVPGEVVRFKALLRVDAAEGPWLLVHGVSGRVDVRFVTPNAPPSTNVWVFFGQGIASLDLEALCEQRLLAPKA